MKNYADYYHSIKSIFKRLHIERPQSTRSLNGTSIITEEVNTKQKALMGLSIAITNQSEEHMALNLHNAIRAGASKSELIETIELCAALGDQSVLLFACSAYSAIIQLEQDSNELNDSFYS